MEKPLKLFSTTLIFVFLLIISNSVPADDSSTCLMCHDTMAQSLLGSPHQLDEKNSLSSPIKVECMNCHDGWQEHIENPSPENISRGDSLSLQAEAELCSRCHLTTHQVAMASTDPHQRADLSCSSCHKIHNNHSQYLVKEDLQNYCITCHQSVAMEFNRRSVHPLHAGIIKCVDCHHLSSTKIEDFAHGFDWTCQSCHDDKAGPFLYEHPVVYNYLVEGNGCTECHQPHGSVNDRLLKQPGSGTCLQCHSIPPGHLVMHSGLGSKLPCVECHTDIHGSYESRLFLDPDLGTKFFPDCYQSGCHTLNGN